MYNDNLQFRGLKKEVKNYDPELSDLENNRYCLLKCVGLKMPVFNRSGVQIIVGVLTLALTMSSLP